MLQLLTGQPPADTTQHPATLYARMRRRLPAEAAAVSDSGCEAWPAALATDWGVLAKQCVQATSDDRPSMEQVVAQLNGFSNALEEQAATPYEAATLTRECVVCMDAPRHTRLRPCCHSLLCEACASQLINRGDRCPGCRGDINSFEVGDFAATYVTS